MRKSSVTSRSSFPSGASSCQATSFGFCAAGLAEVLALHAVRGAEQVLQEILVSLAGRAEQVGAPDEHVARPVRRIVRVVAGQLQLARLAAPWRRSPSAPAPPPAPLSAMLERVGLQLRRRRQPAHALGAHVVVDQRAVPRRRPARSATGFRRRPASRSATGRCARRRTRWSSSAAAGGSSRARRRAAVQPVCGRSFSCPT